MDEVFIRIRGMLHYLWRVADQRGHVLDILVKSRRNAKTVRRFFRELLRGVQYVPRVIVTDKLRSYAAAKREILPEVERRLSRYLNYRVELSHQATRRRERQMQRFKSARYAHRFLSTHSRIHNHVQLRRHRLTATALRASRDAALQICRRVPAVASVVWFPGQLPCTRYGLPRQPDNTRLAVPRSSRCFLGISLLPSRQRDQVH